MFYEFVKCLSQFCLGKGVNMIGKGELCTNFRSQIILGPFLADSLGSHAKVHSFAVLPLYSFNNVCTQHVIVQSTCLCVC